MRTGVLIMRSKIQFSTGCFFFLLLGLLQLGFGIGFRPTIGDGGGSAELEASTVSNPRKIYPSRNLLQMDNAERSEQQSGGGLKSKQPAMRKMQVKVEVGEIGQLKSENEVSDPQKQHLRETTSEKVAAKSGLEIEVRKGGQPQNKSEESTQIKEVVEFETQTDEQKNHQTEEVKVIELKKTSETEEHNQQQQGKGDQKKTGEESSENKEVEEFESQTDEQENHQTEEEKFVELNITSKTEEHNQQQEGKGDQKKTGEESSENEEKKEEQQQSKGNVNPESVETHQQGEQQQKEDQNETGEEILKEEEKKDEQQQEKHPYQFRDPYLIGPSIKDWDEQRRTWLDTNPQWKPGPDGKPRVLIVSGSKATPCQSPVGGHINIKSFKLKMDYARMHNFEFYYNFAYLDPLFNSFWVKLPLIRKLMITHPEIEWIFWVDADAVFTDMLFEPPFETYAGSDMVMWGWEYGLFHEKSGLSFSDGVFLLRNSQWSLDLIDKWSPFGPDGPLRRELGIMLSKFLTNREPWDSPSDDQAALAYLILTDELVKDKVKFVDSNEYLMSGYWPEVVGTYENSMEKYHPGFGDWRWPWVTHFSGCRPCSRSADEPGYEDCQRAFDRAYHFADNQVLAYLGFQHESLYSPDVIRMNETQGIERHLESVGLNPWADRIAQAKAAAERTAAST